MDKDKRTPPDEQAKTTPAVRESKPLSGFAAFVLLLVRLTGFAIALFGAHLLVRSDMPAPLGFAVLGFGLIQLLCAQFLRLGERMAWAFLCSTNGVAILVTLFGAAKIRDSAEIEMSAALLPCFGFAVVATLLVVAADDFLEL